MSSAAVARAIPGTRPIRASMYRSTTLLSICILLASVTLSLGLQRTGPNAVEGGKFNHSEWHEMTLAKPSWGSHKIDTFTPQECKYRIAVVTSGTLRRYFLESTVQGLLSPMVRQGHAVDYFVGLTAEVCETWQPDARGFVPEVTADMSEARLLISRKVNESGARARSVTVESDFYLDREEFDFVTNARWNGGERRAEAQAARRSVARMMKMLDRQRKAVEDEEARSGKYDLVFVVKDDALWLEPFNLTNILPSTCSSEAFASSGWSLLCEEPYSTYPPPDAQLTEYILIAGTGSTGSHPFLSMYSILMKGSIGEDGPPRKNKYWGMRGYERFALAVSEDYGINMTRVPPKLLPMQRGGHLRDKDGSVKVCLHAVCDACLNGTHGNVPLLRPQSYYPMCSKM